MVTGDERVLSIFRAAPGQLLTACDVVEAMINQGHDFGPSGRTATARTALVTATLNRLASTDRSQLAAGSPLDATPRWHLPTQAAAATGHAPPPAPPTEPLAEPTPPPAIVFDMTFAASHRRSSWRCLTPRNRVLAALTIVLCLVAVALLVAAVS